MRKLNYYDASDPQEAMLKTWTLTDSAGKDRNRVYPYIHSNGTVNRDRCRCVVKYNNSTWYYCYVLERDQSPIGWHLISEELYSRERFTYEQLAESLAWLERLRTYAMTTQQFTADDLVSASIAARKLLI